MDHAQLPAINEAQLPATYEAAKTALSECTKLDECQSWADKAKALASYARQAKDDSMRKMAERIQARAIGRAGEILAQIEPGKTGPKPELGAGALPQLTRTQAAEDAGLSDWQRKTALRVASIDKDEFERVIESDNPPTVTQLAEMGTKKQIVDLKGRDPKEFNKALHFVAIFEYHLKRCSEHDVDSMADILTDAERERLRGFINQIDSIHDKIMTRV